MNPDKSMAPVMHDVQLQSQGRLLVRPPRKLPAVSLPATSPGKAGAVAGDAGAAPETTLDEVREQARLQGHAEGLAQGREAGFAAGREAGLSAGRKAGIDAVQAAAASERLRFAKLLQAATSEFRRALEYAEDDMIALAFGIACRVVGEAAASRSGLAHLLQRALEQHLASSLLAVRLHPDDLRALQEDGVLQATLARTGAQEHVQWIADARLETGGCMLDSAAGSLDARLESQMQCLCEALLAARQARREGGAPC